MSDEDRSLLAQMMQMLRDLDRKIEAHMAAEELRLEKMDDHIASIDGIVQAFPHTQDGIPDFRGHRHDHDSRMEDGRSWDRTWQAVKNKVAENIVTAIMILLVLGYTTWQQQEAEKRHVSAEANVSATQEQMKKLVEAVKSQQK